ncbi:MAG: cytochrome P450 [Pseudomonadota bacterium]
MKFAPAVLAEHGLTDSFVPPYPERVTRNLQPWEYLWRAHKNLLSFFHVADFQNRDIAQTLFRRRFVLTNRPAGVRETLTDQHAAFERKNAIQRVALKPLLGDGLFVSDGETWAERRAAVDPIIHGRRVKDFGPIMSDVAREWCEDWGSDDGATRDILFEMGEMTAEVISRTIFGTKLGREATQKIIAGFATYQANVRAVSAVLLRLPGPLGRPLTKKGRRAKDEIHAVIDNLIDRLAGERGEPAVVRSLFAATDRNGAPLTREAIRNEAIVLFMAGHETTANTLAWALYLVSQSPRVAERLRDEFAAVLDGRHPTLSDVAALTYTRAVIEETLRLYPPVPILAREATAPGTLGDDRLAPGDVLVVSPWLLQRNPDIYSLPDHFIPERFTGLLGPRPRKHANIPFAAGPRTCPGRIFALAEASICLAALLQRFEVTLNPGTHVAVDCRLTLRPTAPLSMTVTKR